MYVLSAAEIRNWDQFTINNEPIASIDLMERAAARCFEWIIQQGFQKNQFYIFCGKGNNGGDGLAIARLLMQSGYKISIYILNTEEPGSADFQENLKRLLKLNAAIRLINVVADLPDVQKDGIFVDALFGTGLSRPVAGIAENIIALINDSRAKVISIDLPSGMFADKSSVNNMIVRAHFTLTFQCYKLGLLVAENELFTGKVILLQIGLHPAFVPGNLPVTKILTQKLIEKLYRPRSSFAHKGTFGHALIMGGSKGKIGAMILAVRACLHTGAGLTSASIPGCGYVIIQSAVPEAMAIADPDENQLTKLPNGMDKYHSIGIGPGMGVSDQTIDLMKAVFSIYNKPLVVDADGLNCLAKNKDLLQELPSQSILTPHPKEFDRLFGDHASDFDRITTAREMAAKLNCIIILKGHHTLIAGPDAVFFNNNGNAGMAKGGSGDALTGIITALLAQGYNSISAAALGVYIHGAAGDIAAYRYSQEAMTPSNLIQCIGDVFLKINSLQQRVQ